MQMRNSGSTKKEVSLRERAEFFKEEELFKHALSLRDRERFCEAINILLGFVKRYPNLPAASGMLGGVYFQAGRYEEAVACLERTVELSPRSELACGILFHSLLKLGRIDDAKAELRRFLTRTKSEKLRSLLTQLEALPSADTREFDEIVSKLGNV